MAEQLDDEARSSKRLKTSRTTSELSPLNEPLLASLQRSITPPGKSRGNNSEVPSHEQASKLKVITSPIQLTHIRDLPASSGGNVHAVRLKDILGDPLIRECWQFNYLHDVDFIMKQFDEDVRSLVQVKIVHGSWKREAPNRIRIDVSNPIYFGRFLSAIAF
jgi:tyrosyl-DNA phosphodiesterase-1